MKNCIYCRERTCNLAGCDGLVAKFGRLQDWDGGTLVVLLFVSAFYVKFSCGRAVDMVR